MASPFKADASIEVKSQSEKLEGPDDDVGSYSIVSEIEVHESEDDEQVPEPVEEVAVAQKRPRYEPVDAAAEPLTEKDIANVRVSSMVPPEISSEALRMTNKSIFKFPWEKGRLGKIFSPAQPAEGPSSKLQPGLDSLVKLQVNVEEGASLATSMSLDVQKESTALFTKAVKHMSGGSYLEERSARRQNSVKLWWQLLSVNPSCHDPGIAASVEAPSGEESQYALEVLDACMAIKSPNTIAKRYYSMKSYQDWLSENYMEDWLPMREVRAWAHPVPAHVGQASDEGLIVSGVGEVHALYSATCRSGRGSIKPSSERPVIADVCSQETMAAIRRTDGVSGGLDPRGHDGCRPQHRRQDLPGAHAPFDKLQEQMERPSIRLARARRRRGHVP